jgi:hypothetical protein
VRFIVGARRKIGLVRGNERQFQFIGKLYQRWLGDPLGLEAMPLQLDIKTFAVDSPKAFKSRLG